MYNNNDNNYSYYNTKNFIIITINNVTVNMKFKKIFF